MEHPFCREASPGQPRRRVRAAVVAKNSATPAPSGVRGVGTGISAALRFARRHLEPPLHPANSDTASAMDIEVRGVAARRRESSVTSATESRRAQATNRASYAETLCSRATANASS